MPEQCEMPHLTEVENDCVTIMRTHFPNGVERSVLISKIEEELSASNNTARVKVSRAIKRGLLTLYDGTVMLPLDKPPRAFDGSIIERGCSDI